MKRKTASSRLSRALQGIGRWCRFNRHLPVPEQHRLLSQKLLGHYAYYGITGNGHCLSAFAHWVRRIWRKWLSWRNRQGPMLWPVFRRLSEHYALPAPVVVHSKCRP